MSTGEGIFLSVFLIIIFYLLTKIKNWCKIIKIIIIALILILICSWIGFFIYQKYETYPRKVIEYGKIKIGDSTEDVLFYKSYPVFAMTNEIEKFTKAFYERNKKEKDYTILKDFKPIWLYIDDNSEYEIYFNDDQKVKSIKCRCARNKPCYSWVCPHVSSIGINSSYDDVVKVFGEADDYEKRNGMRILNYSKYNLAFYLHEDKVDKIIVQDLSNE